jgi:hypothetical protein
MTIQKKTNARFSRTEKKEGGGRECYAEESSWKMEGRFCNLEGKRFRKLLARYAI